MLPIGLERADLRVIHAAWLDEQIEVVRALPWAAFASTTERKAGTVLGQDFKLAALRWPERIVQFDDGHHEMTRHTAPVTA
ncbi:MAG: hypothetical protein A3E79_01870 [Burkholderiales bacterium RIFCSPHIGHO2_12_FULL_61_11]|nr:MAG: hypothetical protein A3E79_01870 [Burkholderiales bacterium RIFCSPHIGHO2_12_FULL_61_11]